MKYILSFLNIRPDAKGLHLLLKNFREILTGSNSFPFKAWIWNSGYRINRP